MCSTAILASALALGPGHAHAQERITAIPPIAPLMPEPEGLTLTPFLGVGLAGDYENAIASFGVALGYGMNSRVSLEGELFAAPFGALAGSAAFDTKVWALGGSIVYHFMREHFTPYLIAGIGVMVADTEAKDVGVIEHDAAVAFASNWGGGLKTALSDRFGLRADVRYFGADEVAPDQWRLYAAVVIRHIGR